MTYLPHGEQMLALPVEYCPTGHDNGQPVPSGQYAPKNEERCSVSNVAPLNYGSEEITEIYIRFTAAQKVNC